MESEPVVRTRARGPMRGGFANGNTFLRGNANAALFFLCRFNLRTGCNLIRLCSDCPYPRASSASALRSEKRRARAG